MSAPAYLSADEAADRLDITKNTLYAYVSRGLIRSKPGPGRTRRYDARDIQRLADGSSRTPAVASTGEDPGPRFTSSLVTINDGNLFYRGRDACRLARSHDFEEVTHLFWHPDGAHADGNATGRVSPGGSGDTATIPPDVYLMAPLLSGLS
ncbi:MAG: helix-turn-helix domain-containing protein, partial [Bacteroidetes bacterium]|nr:helix-turn-helix domain-containing protein [Bacteroidota bacterium]